MINRNVLIFLGWQTCKTYLSNFAAAKTILTTQEIILQINYGSWLKNIQLNFEDAIIIKQIYGIVRAKVVLFILDWVSIAPPSLLNHRKTHF